jgi:hypothetical protein
MSSKFLSYLAAGALGVTLALASPAFGHGFGGGGGGHGGGMGGGGHFGGMGGGMGGGHFGGMGGGHFSGMGGGHFGGMGGGHFVGGHFVGGHFAGGHFFRPGFSPRFAFHGGFRHRVFDRRLHRFVFVGFPYTYASYDGYDSCYRRVWTPVGLQWVNICGDYNYGY